MSSPAPADHPPALGPAPHTVPQEASRPAPLFNQPWRYVQIFMIIGGTSLAGGLLLIVLSAFFESPPAVAGGPPQRTDSSVLLLAFGFVGLIVAVVCIVSIAFTILPSRRAAKRLAAFGAGDFVAHWVYPDAFWQAWVAREVRKRGRLAWWVVIPLGLIGLLIGSVIATNKVGDRADNLLEAGVIFVNTGVLIAVIFGYVRVYTRRRRRRMLDRPECYIGLDTAYCGGDLIYWNQMMMVLRLAAVEEGDPPVLCLGSGLSRNLAGLTGAIASVGLESGRYVDAQEQLNRLRIPLLPEHRPRIDGILKKLRAHSKQ